MKLFSICLLLLLTSCQSIEKNEPQLKQVAHDAVDEMIDDVVDEVEKK